MTSPFLIADQGTVRRRCPRQPRRSRRQSFAQYRPARCGSSRTDAPTVRPLVTERADPEQRVRHEPIREFPALSHESRDVTEL